MESEASLLVDPSPYWDSEEADYKCDCPGPPPPPQFRLPPPPAPPTSRQCQAGYDSDLPYCHIDLVEAEYSQTPFPSLPVIAVCSSIIAVAVLVAIYVLWRHKKKVQNFLPCNHKPKDRRDLSGSNGVTYDDVLIHHHPTRLPPHGGGSEIRSTTPFELFDSKYDGYQAGRTTPLGRADFLYPVAETRKTNDHFNPIYEEVSGGSEERRSYNSEVEDSEAERRTTDSEDDFAEDELSLAREEACSATSSVRGSTGGDLCKDVGSSDGQEEEEGLFPAGRPSPPLASARNSASYGEAASHPESSSPFPSPASLWYGAYPPENWTRDQPALARSQTKNRQRSAPPFSTFHPVSRKTSERLDGDPEDAGTGT